MKNAIALPDTDPNNVVPSTVALTDTIPTHCTECDGKDSDNNIATSRADLETFVMEWEDCATFNAWAPELLSQA